ncbi:MAG: sulfite exporter TauE/SafE family protein, partial [Acetobacteraceae bacterium]|nr:sulfite exporter TauE/SafE family protein [Acetobacteraceae bacterium]
MLADCLHDLTALGPHGLAALVGALFLAGLAAGATHCAGMCAPFVLAQASAGAGAGGGVLRRLSGAALVPYHLGRMLGYSALGAIAGGSAGALARIGGLDIVLAALLLGGAALMLAQALRQGAPYLPAVLAGPAGRLAL